MEPVILNRTDDLPLSFRGQLVAEASSAEPGKPRHTELRLWATDDDGFVVESVGVSAVPGEDTLRAATPCGTVNAVIASLRKSDSRSGGVRRSYLPDIAWRLLKDAHTAGALVLPDVETV